MSLAAILKLKKKQIVKSVSAIPCKEQNQALNEITILEIFVNLI